MHWEANSFIERVKNEYPDYFKGRKVLEAGSLDINGSVRQFFNDCDYTGIDIGEGPGVDVIAGAQGYVRPELFDVVISAEMLEHDRCWAQSLKQMYANLKPGGLFILTCAAPNRWEHGTTKTDGGYGSPFTSDYYRNISAEDFASILPPSFFSKSYLGYRGDKEDLYFAGIKSAQVEIANPSERIAAPAPVKVEKKLEQTVTVEVSTLNRLFTTLPATIASIATQTRKPERFVLYDDGEQQELRSISPYRELFQLLEQVGIEIETFTTPRLGLATNRQHALETAKTDFLLRLDDDHVLEPDCIEKMLKVMEDETIGAVAPLVHHPGNVHLLPTGVEGTVSDVFNGTNLQWFQWNSGPRETEHLYSCYMYRVSAGRKAGGYPKLSPVSFREDSWFSMKIKRAGYRLVVDPSIKVWHLQQAAGGVRAFSDGSLWAQDDAAFRDWLASIDVEDKSPKLIVLDCGIGDTFAFKGILPTLKERFKERGMIIAIAHVGILEDEGIPLISIGEAQQRLGHRYGESNLYEWCWRVGNEKPLAEAMLEFWR